MALLGSSLGALFARLTAYKMRLGSGHGEVQMIRSSSPSQSTSFISVDH